MTFPSGGGPTTVCNVAFACDSGNYALSCTESGTDVTCQCGTDTGTAGVSFPLTAASLQCTTAGGALEAANGGCQFGVMLTQ